MKLKNILALMVKASTLWTEKYRPNSVEDLDCSEYLKKFLETAKKDGFPHLLLYGPPGTGKTTFAGLLNPTYELNASDDRGIDTIRNKIKMVANTVSQQVILMDECENLTKDSQTCLRRILEDYPNTRFIFCTNYISKIINPLKSRLLKFKFVLKDCTSLEKIGRKEGFEFDSAFYTDLFKKCNRDLRKSLNILQAIKPINKEIKSGLECKNSSIQNLTVDDFIGYVPESVVSSFFQVKESAYKCFVQSFLYNSYNLSQFLYQLTSVKGTDKQKAEFSKILAECESKSVSGCGDEFILEFLCLNYISIYK